MQNINIVIITKILKNIQLDLKESLSRRRFLKLFRDTEEDINLEAEEIRKKYCEKNPDGSKKIVEELIQFTKENRKLANKEFKLLDTQEVKIDFTGYEQDKENAIKFLEKEVKTFEDSLKDKATAEQFDYLENVKEAISELR